MTYDSCIECLHPHYDGVSLLYVECPDPGCKCPRSGKTIELVQQEKNAEYTWTDNPVPSGYTSSASSLATAVAALEKRDSKASSGHLSRSSLEKMLKADLVNLVRKFQHEHEYTVDLAKQQKAITLDLKEAYNKAKKTWHDKLETTRKELEEAEGELVARETALIRRLTNLLAELDNDELTIKLRLYAARSQLERLVEELPELTAIHGKK